jgi:hypothetical protein
METSGSPTGNALLGHMSFASTVPPAGGDVGPWFVDLDLGVTTWHLWNPAIGDYDVPVQKISDGGNYEITLDKPNATKATVVTLPNKSGTVMLLLDTYVPRPTIILSGTAPTLTWTSASDPFDGVSSGNYLHKLTGNTTYSFALATDGQVINIAIENNGTSYTVTWPNSGGNDVKWTNGTEPTQPVGTASTTGLGLYTLRKINGNIYGEFQNSTPALPVSSVPTGGTKDVSGNYGPPVDNRKFPY